jgi:hypothetical protein
MFLSTEEKGNYAAVNQDIGEYLMIDKLNIKNFRCFKSAKIENLKRLNIIVGKNASGKTVLLESIKVGLDGLPQALPWLNQLRNIFTILPPNSTPEQFRMLFIDFFHQFDSEAEMVITIEDSKHRIAEVRIHFDPRRATTIQPQLGFRPQELLPSTPPVTVVPLAFSRTNFEGVKDVLVANMDAQGGLSMDQGKSLGIVSGYISSGNFGGPGESGQSLSRLNIEKRDQELIKAINRHFPFVSDVTSQSPSGIATLYANLPSLPRKIPLSLVSGGISRLFTLMLCVAQYEKGVVLIDEIENGIYHEQYPLLWETLLDLAKAHETQLFISTHSLECLHGLLPSIKTHQDEILLLRLDRENGSSKITSIESKFIEAAIEQGFDVR